MKKSPEKDKADKLQRRSLKLKTGEPVGNGILIVKTTEIEKNGYGHSMFDNVTLCFASQENENAYIANCISVNNEAVNKWNEACAFYHTLINKFGIDYANIHFRLPKYAIENWTPDTPIQFRCSVYGLARNKDGAICKRIKDRPDKEWWSIV